MAKQPVARLGEAAPETSPFLLEFFMVQVASFRGMAYCGQDGKWHEAYSDAELEGEISFLEEVGEMKNTGEEPKRSRTIRMPRAWGKLDAMLVRIDLVALLTAGLGVGLLAATVAATAVVQLGKLISLLWAEPFDRWLIIGLGVAVVWVIVRWKRMCLF
jgi:hypothetical protein